MFVKFTRLDGTPIWINACFVVTIEPRRQGGSTVVPIGDGLDYDVRETAEEALALLGQTSSAAPAQVAEALSAPSVIPVPPPKALPEKFTDVVAAGLSAPQPDEVDTKPVEEPKPAVAEEAPAKPVRKRRTTKAATAAAEGEAKPKKATRTRKTKKAAAEEAPSEVTPAAGPVSEQKAAPEQEGSVPPPMTITVSPSVDPAMDATQIERIRKMAPRSLKKLRNTLMAQFPVTDVEATIHYLVTTNVLSLDAQDHVTWLA